MADLLECVIQIKALEHSIGRLERFVAEAPAGARAEVDAVLGRLLDAERAYARALGRPTVTDDAGEQAAGVARFAALRRAALALLRARSAQELGQTVDWPGRPGTSAADLVAIMLAHDTERIGELQHLSVSPPNPPPQ